jgi:hypothetical protein
VPSKVLADASGHRMRPDSVDTFTWEAVKWFPTVKLPPGAEFRLRLPVARTVRSLNSSRISAGEYDVTFKTQLELLVGEADGRWKDFAPIRLVVTSTTQGVSR